MLTEWFSLCMNAQKSHNSFSDAIWPRKLSQIWLPVNVTNFSLLSEFNLREVILFFSFFFSAGITLEIMTPRGRLNLQRCGVTLLNPVCACVVTSLRSVSGRENDFFLWPFMQ